MFGMSLVSVNQGLRGSKVLGKSLKRIKTQIKLSTGQSVHEDLPYTSKLQQQTIVSILSKNKNYKYQNIDFYYMKIK
jgi:hypothetical protein